jgi:hypothetical protein
VTTITAYDRHVQQLFEVIDRVARALAQAGVEYRVVGGLAVFLHVYERDPLAARSTRDIDIAVDRRDMTRIIAAIRPLGLEHRHVAGVDMLVDANEPRARSAVHLIFVGEKVRAEYSEPIPGFSTPARTTEGVLLAPIADLVRMKLTSFRLRDRVHLKDMDGVGLITPEIEAGLPIPLRGCLSAVRVEE